MEQIAVLPPPGITSSSVAKQIGFTKRIRPRPK